MDPDVPLPSLEGTQGPDTDASSHVIDRSDTTSRPPKTPLKSKSRSPGHAQTPATMHRSSSSASAHSERLSSPSLRAQQSLTNLNAPRGGIPQMAQFRRTSSNLKPATPIPAEKNGTMTSDAQRKSWTPSTVAKAFFRKELEQHSANPSKVVVIVHDSCYGHRFSRPRTTKITLSTIVERPERILATLLGASLAYVRLGGRHADSTYPPHPETNSPAQSAPFQIYKTSRNITLDHAAVTAVHGSKWMEELQIMCDSAEAKLAINGKELVRPIGYGKTEDGKPLPKLHEGDLYLCAETLAALQGCLGGVCEAVDTVFADKVTKRAFVCIRPPGHHCSSDLPSGFCWLNNVHVGITYAAMNHGLTHAAIIDFDLHHGDGSQTIAWDHNTKAKELPKHAAAYKRTPIGYYSLHDINSYPCEWGDEDKIRNASVCVENAHGLSIWNVHLEQWKNHTEFWKLYDTRYLILLEKTRKFLKHHSAALRASGVRPKAAIFLSAGFDASEWEGAGMQRHGVNVPTDFYARFTSDVVKLSQEDDLGVDERIISVLEGGYSDRALTSGVMSHVCGLVDDGFYDSASEPACGLGVSMSNPAARGESSGTFSTQPMIKKHSPSWWDAESLDTIEAVVAGRLPPAARDISESASGNYSSPTQASNARMTESARERRSLSAQLEARLSLIERPAPPPPDVDWSVAAHELSQLIIPSDRQTTSCRPTDLNAEATRIRKERQSGIGVIANPTAEPMQLRERKVKPRAVPTSPARSSSRTRSESRRTTIASFNDLPDRNMPVPPLPPGAHSKPRRRSSAGSGIVSGLSETKLHDSHEGSKQSSETSASQSSATERLPDKAVKPVAVRKPRTVATKPAATGKIPARKPVLGAPNLSRQNSNASDNPSVGLQQASSNQSRQTSAASDASADLDSITNGMGNVSLGNVKSIKLKMPTRERHNENQKKVEVGQTKPLTETKATRKPAIPRAPKVKPAPTVAPPPTAAAREPSTDAGKHIQSPETGNGISREVSGLQELTGHPIFGPGAVPPAGAQKNLRMVDSSDVAHQPASFPEKENVIESAPLMGPPPAVQHALSESPSVKTAFRTATSANVPDHEQILDASRDESVWMFNQHAHPTVGDPSSNPRQFVPPATQPVSSTSRSRPMTPQQHQLPKFTATSPIPFAPAPNASPWKSGSKQEENKPSVWDVPDTPR